eukprot:COSAG01_NODE_4875_length_4661_cov_2.548882_1_plen_435_part_00
MLPRRAAAALLPRRVTGRAVWSCEEWVGVAVGWLRECGERERRRQVCAPLQRVLANMASVLEPPPEIGFVVYKDRIVYEEEHHIEEGWSDRESVERNSPRLKRALRSTGVLWKDLQVKTQADFAMEGTQPVPPDIQRQRLYAHEKLRQEQLCLVLEARRGMLRDGMRLTGASSAPPSMMDGGDGEKVLTPMEMAKQKAEQALALREMKRQATREAGEKRLQDLAKQMEVAAVLAEEAAKKQDEVTAQFEAKKREQARSIIEKRQASMEFRLKRERQKELELQAEFVFARKAEEARIRKEKKKQQQQQQQQNTKNTPQQPSKRSGSESSEGSEGEVLDHQFSSAFAGGLTLSGVGLDDDRGNVEGSLFPGEAEEGEEDGGLSEAEILAFKNKYASTLNEEKEKRAEKLRQNWNMRKAQGVATAAATLDGDVSYLK